MKKNNYNISEKGERASGDQLFYFFFHNCISAMFFLIATFFIGVYGDKEFLMEYNWMEILFYVSRKEFWELSVFKIFPIMILSSIFGRIGAFYSIKCYYKYRDRKSKIRRTTKKWSEFNTGINRMGMRFILTAFISTFIYTMGIVAILSSMLFNETLLLPLLIAYMFLKIATYFFVRYVIGKFF